MNTITFDQNDVDCTVRAPQYGYTSVLHLPFHYFKTKNSYRIWDDGSSYDYRACEIDSWDMDATEHLSFSQFLRSTYIARGWGAFNMNLGVNPTGFFPFGPDLGDKGTFSVRVLALKQGNIQYAPYLHYNNTLVLVLNKDATPPVYTPPDPENPGPLSLNFGEWDEGEPLEHELRMLFPQQPAQHELSMAIKSNLLRSGDVSTLDTSMRMDRYDTDLLLDMQQGNAARLLTYLRTYRATPITITPPDYTTIFGMELWPVIYYKCLLLSNDVRIRHDRLNRFTTQLRLNRYYAKELLP